MTRKEIQKKYISEFQKLGDRAKNFLEYLGLHEFNVFYKNIVQEGIRLNFRNLRNCGIKTETELKNFVKKFPSNKNTNQVKFLKAISSNWLLQQK